MTDTLAQEQHAPLPEPLRPHRYPLPIVLAAILTLWAAIYAANGIPRLLDAGANLQRGEADVNAGRFDAAIPPLKAVLREAPRSHSAAIDLAAAQFATGDLDGGIETLRGVSLSMDDVHRLDALSPIPTLDIFEEQDR